MSRQYVTCRFGTSSRTYTYANDTGEPFAPGDEARVETKHGWVPVTIEEVDVPEPPFACKPVIRHPEKEAEA